MAVSDLRSKIKRYTVIGPNEAYKDHLVKRLENEIQDLKNLNR